jgi:hypothetical protein
MSTTTALNRRAFLMGAGISASLTASNGGNSVRAVNQQNSIIYRNEHGYSAWPTILKAANGDIVIAFDEAMRRSTITHGDPTYYAMLLRSTDGGKTWGLPSPIGGYENMGVEAIGAAVLRDGTILGQCYHPRYYTEAEGRKKFSGKVPGVVHRKEFPWYQEHGNYNFVYRSTDHGLTWEPPVGFDASPYKMAFMLRSAQELADGTLVLPCTEDSFGPGKNFVVFSKDRGRTWGKVTAITRDANIFFSEPALLALPSGKLIAMMRTHQGGDYFLYQADSLDGGNFWSESRRTAMWGYPAHLLLLANGSILCVYGRRKEPFGIRACLSNDEGKTWDTNHELVIRDDFRNGNLGYPTSIQLDDGRILTAYYGEDSDGITCIHGSLYQIVAS